MDAFRFSPELFEIRTSVIEALDDAGFQWLSHYSAVDPLHDLYGIEVCGIHDRDDAIAVKSLLQRMLPDWMHSTFCYKDYGREPGYKVGVHRDSPGEDEQWETA